jgi:hypothetical protein
VVTGFWLLWGPVFVPFLRLAGRACWTQNAASLAPLRGERDVSLIGSAFIAQSGLARLSPGLNRLRKKALFWSEELEERPSGG